MKHPNEPNPYSLATEGLENLGEVLEAALKPLLGQAVVLHAMPWRVKEKDSADRKILANPKKYSSYGDLHDLLGLRIITLFEDDLDAAELAIRKVVKVDPMLSGDKKDKYLPNEFGYRSRHYVGSLTSARLRLPENARFSNHIFEIQLRSILQHAWAEIEHDLGYKPGRPISTEHRRRFSQLAAVMELADEGFSKLRSELTSTEIAEMQAYSSEGARPLTIATLDAYIRKDAVFRAFDRRVALNLQTTLGPVGKGMRERVGYLLDLAGSVGWTSVDDISNALEVFRERALIAAKATSEQEKLRLEIPSGEGLRPGFSLILLIEAALSEGERE